MNENDIAIIGAGPAGIAAALQLARFEIHPFIYEADRAGGLLYEAGLVENYPGFPKGVQGPELAERIAASLDDSRSTLYPHEVTAVDYREDAFHVMAGGSEAEFSRLIMATGTKPRMLDDVDFEDGTNEEILYSIQGLRGSEGQSIAIIGAGDAAFDWALTLARKNDVTILQRSGSPRCNASLLRRARESERITVLEGTSVSAISRSDTGRFALALYGGGCLLRDRMTVDNVLAAVGREPRLECVSRTILGHAEEMAAAGRLRFVGDVVNGLRRQAAIAAGDGVRAAIDLCTVD
jgi:thioredoxin reductase (NADPH)